MRTFPCGVARAERSADELFGKRQQLAPPADSMAVRALCALSALVLAAAGGLRADKSQCGTSEFWNADAEICVPCASCKQYPKTPSCNTCKPVEETSDVWKLAAIASFSVLGFVLIGAVLIIGVMMHRRKSHKRPLREPIEETAGPLYQA